jgi:hypothetical protein
VGSRFGDWIYLTSLLQLYWIVTIHTFNSWITNLSLYFYFFWISDWSLFSSLLQLSTTDCQWITCPFVIWCGPRTENTLELFVCCYLRIRCHGNASLATCYLVTTSSLYLLWRKLNRCSSTDVWLWLHYSGFQPSRHNMYTSKIWGSHSGGCEEFHILEYNAMYSLFRGASRRFLAWFNFRSSRWRLPVPPKRRLTLNGLDNVISEKIELFICTQVSAHAVLMYLCMCVCVWSTSIRIMNPQSSKTFT